MLSWSLLSRSASSQIPNLDTIPRLASLPSSQLSPLTRASRLNLAGNSFQVAEHKTRFPHFQLQEVPSHALRSLQRLEQLDLSHLARLSQVQVMSDPDSGDDHGDQDVDDDDEKEQLDLCHLARLSQVQVKEARSFRNG